MDHGPQCKAWDPGCDRGGRESMLELMSTGKNFLNGAPADIKTNSKSVGPHETGKL